jgi:hypothetical protein
MATYTEHVLVVARATSNSAMSWTTSSAVSITAGMGERARRQAVATAVVAADSTSSVTNRILYNGCDIPASDYPAGHIF